jgi:hypothetical protein
LTALRPIAARSRVGIASNANNGFNFMFFLHFVATTG